MHKVNQKTNQCSDAGYLFYHKLRIFTTKNLLTSPKKGQFHPQVSVWNYTVWFAPQKSYQVAASMAYCNSVLPTLTFAQDEGNT